MPLRLAMAGGRHRGRRFTVDRTIGACSRSLVTISSQAAWHDMEIIRAPRVSLVAITQFTVPAEIAAKWTSDTDADSQLLIEFAGRMCYQSWSNPSGRT